MKQLIVLLIATLLGLELMAQEDVTKFLGIPVTGSKTAMIQKLKDKGYTYNVKEDYLEGEFNGVDVRIYVVTNNNKVYRIMVEDKYSIDEGDIKIRFNRLCEQFENNKRYVSYDKSDQRISQNEDISYEMIVNNKRFQAAFYQVGGNDTTDQQKGGINAIKTSKDLNTNKLVWFMINQDYGKYRIIMFYDNVYNQAHGEDL